MFFHNKFLASEVRPYVVNDRLFTEPLKPGLIDYEDEPASKSKESSNNASDQNPRFVRYQSLLLMIKIIIIIL